MSGVVGLAVSGSRVRDSTAAVVAVAAATVCAAVLLVPVLPVLPAASGAQGSGGVGAASMASAAQVGGSGVEGLQYADPTSGLVGVGAPTAASDGSARLAYVFGLPAGRSAASTPSLGLAYDSAGAGGSAGWVGQGWSLSGVGEVRVDTEFGVPLFCPRVVEPVCGDVESESYRITRASGEWDYAAGKRRSYTTRLDYDPATGNLLGKTQRDWDWAPACTGTKCKDEVHTPTSYTLTPTAYPTGTGTGTGTGQHQRTGHNGEPVTYDANGNLTSIQLAADPADKTLRKLTWDADDRLTSIVDAPSGTGGATTLYSYDHTGTLTVDDSGSPTFYLNPWVTYANKTLTTHVFTDDGQRLAARTGPDLTWTLPDGTGNTHLTTDTDGQITQRQEYFPNGQTWLQQTSTPATYGFSGELADSAHGLNDFGRRWYDPTHQLFYSPDPAPTDDPHALLDDPQMTGSYTLNHHNSYRYTDPDGRDPSFHRLLGLWFMEKSDPAPPILADTAPIPLRLDMESDSDDDVGDPDSDSVVTLSTSDSDSVVTLSTSDSDSLVTLTDSDSDSDFTVHTTTSESDSDGNGDRVSGRLPQLDQMDRMVDDWANQIRMRTQAEQESFFANRDHHFRTRRPAGWIEQYERLSHELEIAFRQLSRATYLSPDG